MRKTVKTVMAALSAAAVLAAAVCISACGSQKSDAGTRSLYEQGMEIVALMCEITQSEEYIEFYGGSSEIKSVVQNMSTGDHTTPKAVYAISVPEEKLAAILELSDLANASKELKSFLMQRVLTSLMTQINGRSGVEKLAASSVCTVNKTFVNENVKEDVIYLYTYDNAVPAAVTFIVGEDHAISASGVFILYDEFPCGSADEIASFFSYIGVEVTEVRPE